MTIRNARIKNVTMGLNKRERLSVKMTFKYKTGYCDWEFILTNPTDVSRLMKLMQYTRTDQISNLKEKVVRIVNYEYFFRGFGDAVEDKFIPIFGEIIKEISEKEFKELLEII